MASTRPSFNVLVSVYDKTGLSELCCQLQRYPVNIYTSGGTGAFLISNDIKTKSIEELTHHIEFLEGRVKTLHPAIHGGILARLNEKDQEEIRQLKYENIDLVICNLYPFEKTSSDLSSSLENIIDHIDIGGVTLLRAAAKNYDKAIVICDPNDYDTFLTKLSNIHPNTTAHLKDMISLEWRNYLAFKAFEYTAKYDLTISEYFRRHLLLYQRNYHMGLRYGMNPHQKPAEVFCFGQRLPFQILNGSPSMINFLDALNSWQLVKELAHSLHLPAAASFKHVSPAGAAVYTPFTEVEKKVFMVEDMMDLSHQGVAYARARGGDRMSSYGDWIALSNACDVSTAKLIVKEVSDGIIAPDFEPEALKILKLKKNGSYVVLKMDPFYEPNEMETREVYGITLKQKRNNFLLNKETLLSHPVSQIKDIPYDAERDLILAAITLKYTQSNSVCLAHRGGIIGSGAGQQSRIHCTRLACQKADLWWLRHHPKVLELEFKPNIKRPEKSNAIDAYLSDASIDGNEELETLFLQDKSPKRLSNGEKLSWSDKLKGICLASDGFFPFEDNIHRANKSNVKYILAPLGSIADEKVINEINHYGMSLFCSDIRLFHH